MRITTVEIDDNNLGHVTQRVGVNEIETAFEGSPQIRRNKGEGAAGYFIIANGIRVNFIYLGRGVACSVSAWRV